MNSGSYSVSLTCLFLLLAFSANSYGEKVTIYGSVRNPADNAVKKAVVTLRNLKEEVLFEDITNRKGEFKFEDVEPKFYYLLVEHQGDGSKRIKINPRKNKNTDLSLELALNGQKQAVECYLYGDEPPTLFDPILNIKTLETTTEPSRITLSWRDIKQAKLYTIYENDKKVYVGEETRFEKEITPGVEYCYSIQASGNYELKGEISKQFCDSAPTESPRDIKDTVYKNTIKLEWSPVSGASSYIIYRNDEIVGKPFITSFTDDNLEFSEEYYYKISALDALKTESGPSVEILAKTHELVEVPILSSMNSKTNITLIWNEVAGASSYNLYRENELLESSNATTFADPMPPGKTYCYKISSVDRYDVESDLSNEHCTKVPLNPPLGVLANADVSSMHLNWNEVKGADYYMIYERISQDSISYSGESRSTAFTVKNLDFSEDVCFVVTSIDMDGDESDFSLPACNIVLDPPHFVVENMVLNEPSGNGIIDAKESGYLQFSILNDGQSPAHQVVASVTSKDPDRFLTVGEPFTLDTIEAGRIKFARIEIQGMLQVLSGEHDFELQLQSREEIGLDQPYFFQVETKSMVPPKMIIGDFAVSNEFGTHYIPKNEKVNLTLRVQNVGEGSTESVSINVIKNRTYTMPNFTGKISLPAFEPGDYTDIEIPVMTAEENFAIEVELKDYLARISKQRIDLETMRNYRPPEALVVQDLGVENIEYYPDEIGEIDVDRRIPLGRKNPNGIAVIIGTQDYDDSQYGNLEHADRDRDVVRKYFSQAFGLSDFQMLPSKTWQMDGGPTGDEFRLIFDPYQGDLRKRIISAERYSDMEEINIFIYYRGYGEWVKGRPLLIPKDAKYDRHITKYPLEELVSNLSRLSVLGSIKTITLFLDITYLNYEDSAELMWDFPDLPDKICILSASSNGETSQIYEDKKHSFFTYTLLKGLAGAADDGNSFIDLGEITEYVYKTVPSVLRKQPGTIMQNPKFNGMDLKRIVLDLR